MAVLIRVSYNIYMRKILVCIFIFVAAGLYARETLLMDIGDWEPFTSSRDQDSQVLERLVGEIFALYDIDVEYRYLPWLRSVKNVESGESDGTFPVIRTPERNETTISSREPVLVEETVFFRMKDLKFDWSGFDDLRGYSIGGTVGYAYMQVLEDAGLLIEYVPYEELNFRKLAAGRIDLYPASLHAGIYLINTYFDGRIRSRFTYHPEPLRNEVYYLLISRKNPHAQEIVDKFDQGIRLFRQNGRYDEIMNLLPELDLSDN